jgi:hypothetical protein
MQLCLRALKNSCGTPSAIASSLSKHMMRLSRNMPNSARSDTPVHPRIPRNVESEILMTKQFRSLLAFARFVAVCTLTPLFSVCVLSGREYNDCQEQPDLAQPCTEKCSDNGTKTNDTNLVNPAPFPPEGEYVEAFGHWVTNLSLKKDGYLIERFRLPDETGGVKFMGNHVYLKPTDRQHGRDKEFVYVPWGKRSYLIEPSELISFCNEVNEGKEPRKSVRGSFLLKADDWDRPPTGNPILPKEVKDYILSKPIGGKIVEVFPFKNGIRIPGRPYKEDGFPITIDRGRNHGLRPGMRLTSGYGGGENMIIAFVTKADADRATVLAWWMVTTDDKIAPGTLLYTRPSLKGNR